MQKYNKNNANELKEFLYNNYIHDAKLESFKYDWREDTIRIELFNQFYNVKIALTFLNIRIALKIEGDWSGNRETVISLTVEDDFSCLQNNYSRQSEYTNDSIYLLFQMFSGDELHIVSEEVIVE